MRSPPPCSFSPARGGRPREPDLYPRQTCVTPTSNCQGTGAPIPALPGQVNLTTSGFGNLPGSPGGSISVFYQFVVRRGPNFSFVWHNTTGPLPEGVGSDPGLPSPAVGAHLFAIMEALPRTSIELGSIVSLGFATNGVRDAIFYQQHLRPLILVLNSHLRVLGQSPTRSESKTNPR